MAQILRFDKKIIKLGTIYINNYFFYKNKINDTKKRNLEEIYQPVKNFIKKTSKNNIYIYKNLLTELSKKTKENNAVFIYSNRNINVNIPKKAIEEYEGIIGLLFKKFFTYKTFDFTKLKFILIFKNTEKNPIIELTYKDLCLNNTLIQNIKDIVKDYEKYKKQYIKSPILEIKFKDINTKEIYNYSIQLDYITFKKLLLLYDAEKYINKKISYLIYKKIKNIFFNINIDYTQYYKISKNKKLFLLYILSQMCYLHKNFIEDKKYKKLRKDLNVYLYFKDNIILSNKDYQFFKNIIFNYINLSFNKTNN